MKPMIGVMPLWDDDKESLWMLPGYMDGTAQAGGIPFMFPLTDNEDDLLRLCNVCNGFLFTGGHDVSPSVYGQSPLPGLVFPCEKRDRLEHIVLRYALQKDRPVLGICRGIQFINAALGGTLYQDLPLQHPSSVSHHQHAPYDRPAHEVHLSQGSPLRKCLNAETIAVNSYHHQAICTLSEELSAMAVSDDGLVEAVWRPASRFLWAVQWHPEFVYLKDANSRKIFSAFVSAAGSL